jgi:hypothetical protein
MGRKKLYRTEEELREQSNNRSKRYYSRNKDKCNHKSMLRYWKRKAVDKKLSEM